VRANAASQTLFGIGNRAIGDGLGESAQLPGIPAAATRAKPVSEG